MNSSLLSTDTTVTGRAWSTALKCPSEYEPVKYEPEDNTNTKSSGEVSLQQVISELLESGGRRKQDVADCVIAKISRSDESAPNWATWTAYRILHSPKPGRVDDCLGIFTRLSPTIVRDTLQDAFRRHPPQETGQHNWTEDYWYVLIRSLGRIVGDWPSEQLRDIIELASHFPMVSIRESAILALGDIGDPAAVERLRMIAVEDSHPLLRDLAEEMLEDIAEQTSR